VFAIAGPAHAEYPERSIQFVLSFPPAGATDILARGLIKDFIPVAGVATASRRIRTLDRTGIQDLGQSRRDGPGQARLTSSAQQ
jgi:hypothetical protein